MTLRSKLTLLLLVLCLCLPIGARAASGEDFFTVVPSGDPTYSELKKLADAGWISNNDLAPSLTRFDVAQLILKAEKKCGEIVVAQADMDIPPPPDANAAASNSDVIAAPTTQTQATTAATEEATRAQAIQSLNSLEEAYQYELKLVKDKVQALTDKVNDIDAQQYDLRKRIMGISQFPTIAVHGLGRFLGYAQQFSGDYSGETFDQPGYRESFGFLDLQPEGTVSKEVSWNTILRIGSTFEANESPAFVLRRVTMDFNPPWFSAKIGDFDEAYTPLTLWNRDTLDLAYKPEMWARWDDLTKYESFLNNEPYWPLRGLKMGTDVMWPDSTVLDELKVSGFVHMIRNGFNDNGGWYLGPNEFTDLVFGGTAKVKSQKWYLGGTSVQATVDTYGLLYDEPLETEQPGSPYGQFTPSTWAHQYLIGSVKPDLKVGLGGDFYVGATMEYAGSSYQDNVQNPNTVFTDFALLGGPYVQFGKSRISFNYLNVGPYFYSPLAQTRQDAVTTASASVSYLISPDLFEPTLRNQYFLSALPRAGDIYSFYDRTQDNTFPYGLATPNREGIGGELDINALQKDSLKIKGSAYFVQEISGNLVVNTAGTGFIPVDSPANSLLVPIRNFTYVNIGPSFNLGPYIGFDRNLEIGTNVRYEQTTSDLGTLTSTWLIGGIQVDVLPMWGVALAYGWQHADGTEAGYDGTLWARYSYLYDNSDLGSYTPVTVNGTNQSIRVSNTFKINRNSTLYLDYDFTTGDLYPTNTLQGTLNNQFAEVTYEVKF